MLLWKSLLYLPAFFECGSNIENRWDFAIPFLFFSHCDEGYILTRRSLEFHVLSVSTHILITIKFHWPERNFFNFNIFNNCPSGIELDNVIPCVNRWLAVSKSMGDGITHVPCAMKIEIPIKLGITYGTLLLTKSTIIHKSNLTITLS